MKRSILFAILLLVSFSTFAQENAGRPRNNFFCIGPLDLFLSTLQLSYERQLGANSLALTGGYKLSKKNNEIDRTGGNGELQLRINLLYDRSATNKAAHYSTYPFFAPFVQYRYEDIRAQSQETSNTVVQSLFSGLGFGVRFTGLENRFTLSLFAGGGMKISSSTGPGRYDDFLEVGYTGIAPKIACYMGIAF